MKLYLEPAATTCRGITLFAAEHDLPLQLEHVDILSGAHLTPEFTTLNPNQRVPVLEHDGFVLTEGSAILKYLAEVADSPAYPKALKARARVNEAMDWFNTGLYLDLGYGAVYPQVLPHYQRSHPAAQAETLAQGYERGARWLRLLDQRLGRQEGEFVCGAEISLADYLGSAYVTLAEVVAFDFAPYPFVRNWLQAMRSRPAWDEVNAAFYGWRSAALAQRKAELRLTA
jgi:glutathione S-transferase